MSQPAVVRSAPVLFALAGLAVQVHAQHPPAEREQRFLEALRAYPDEAVARRAEGRLAGAE